MPSGGGSVSPQLICARGWALPGRRCAGLSKATQARALAYLTALLTLGIADKATPALPAELWQGDHGQRVKLRHQEREGDDAEYF